MNSVCAEQVKRKIEIFRGWLLVGVAVAGWAWAVVFMCHCCVHVSSPGAVLFQPRATPTRYATMETT